MAYNPVTWALEQLITSAKLQQMCDNQDTYRIKRISVLSMIGPHTTSSTTDVNIGRPYIYIPSQVDTLEIYANIGASAGTTVTLTLKVNSSASYQLILTSTLTAEDKNGTIDVSGLSEGYHYIDVLLKNSSSVNTSTLKSLNCFLQME